MYENKTHPIIVCFRSFLILSIYANELMFLWTSWFVQITNFLV